MLRTALPDSNVFVDRRLARSHIKQGFWGPQTWKVMSAFGVASFIRPMNLRLINDLGSGGFGDVVQAQLGTHGEAIAIKRIKKRGPSGYGLRPERIVKSSVMVLSTYSCETIQLFRIYTGYGTAPGTFTWRWCTLSSLPSHSHLIRRLETRGAVVPRDRPPSSGAATGYGAALWVRAGELSPSF
ncbi:hypothetical protein B0H11DRAFT_1265631 [Mycena galericulata]|nr:hypothetical protein B0H11DRAFT_1265631 [Mycena galericulata]